MKLIGLTLFLVLATMQKCCTGQSEDDPMKKMYNIDIGGVHYKATGETLKRFPKGKFNLATQSQSSSFYFDRDGIMFRHILNFLRNNELDLPTDFTEHRLLQKEAAFFGLIDLSTALGALGKDVLAKDPEKAEHASVVVVVDWNLNVKQMIPSGNVKVEIANLYASTSSNQLAVIVKALLDMGFVSVCGVGTEIMGDYKAMDKMSVYTFIK